MRRSIAPGVSVVVAALLAPAARPADPEPVPPPAAAGAPAAAGPAVFLPDAPAGVDRNAWLALQIMLGQQTGLRAQFTPVPDMSNPFVVEAFYGAVLTRITASEAAGAGARWLRYRDSREGRDALALGPGLDVLFGLGRGHAVLIAPSLDISWLHGFGGRCGLELGLEAGVGVGTSGERHGGERAGGQVSPLISGFFGLRF